MIQIDRVNESGYRTLLGIANDSPQLFTKPDLNRLRQEMVDRADTEELWAEPINITRSIDSLNDLEERGPDTDVHYAKIIREALDGLSLVDVADELFWASINCFSISEYVPVRWSTSNTRNTNPTNFVNAHWLKSSGAKGRESNAAARLWWLGEISNRASRFSQHSADRLLEAMANEVNLYHQTLARPYLLANPRLVAAIYDLALDYNEHLFQTKYANQLFKSLNLRAGATALDMMDDDELRSVVEEAKPPKEQ